jgi:putative lipoprotein|nr:DUF3465 domain-containing protein [uncultured Neisseria sp.]
MPDAESGIFFEIVMNKNKIIVLLIALVAVFAYQKMQNKQPLQSQNQQKIEVVQKQNDVGENADTAQQQIGSDKESAEAVLKQAFENEQSDIQVEGEGTVWKTLPDDNKGTRHQRFILKLSSGQTLLVVHNIDLADKIKGLKKGDKVAFYGEYEWSEQGGVIHWTHHDPSGRHTDGWLKHDGRLYQ